MDRAVNPPRIHLRDARVQNVEAQNAEAKDAEAPDAEAIAEIYNHYIRETVITFDEQAIQAEQIAARIKRLAEAGYPYLVAEAHRVAEADRKVIGYAHAGPFHSRSAYRYTSEVTVYLAPDATGRGLGTRLYRSLFDRLKAQGIRRVIGGITLPNPASQGLHEKMGMKQVAHYEQVGFKFNQWLDVGYWQRSLDDWPSAPRP